MEIELLPSDAEKIAIDILDGKIPAQVNSMEVVGYLVVIAQERGIRISLYKINSSGNRVGFNMDQALIAIERDLDIRPV